MLLEFVATIASAFGAAGVVMMLNILVGRRLPGWSIPAAAGLGMLAFAVWSEYSWYGRVTAQLPDGVVVASVNETTAWYRPWSFFAPQVNRLIAVDHRFDRRNPAVPGQVLTNSVLMARWEPSRQFGAVFDCVDSRRADLMDEVVFGENGTLDGVVWVQLESDDAVLNAACVEEG
jgi:hypothetical protein